MGASIFVPGDYATPALAAAAANAYDTIYIAPGTYEGFFMYTPVNMRNTSANPTTEKVTFTSSDDVRTLYYDFSSPLSEDIVWEGISFQSPDSDWKNTIQQGDVGTTSAHTGALRINKCEFVATRPSNAYAYYYTGTSSAPELYFSYCLFDDHYAQFNSLLSGDYLSVTKTVYHTNDGATTKFSGGTKTSADVEDTVAGSGAGYGWGEGDYLLPVIYQLSQSDQIPLTDAIATGPLIMDAFTDVLTLTDSFTTIQSIGWADSFALTSAFTYLSEVQDGFSDSFALTDQFGTIVQLAIADAFVLSDTITIDRFLLSLRDSFGLSDSFVPAIQAALSLSDSWGVSDAFTHSLRLGIADAFALGDAFVHKVRLLLSLSDIFSVDDSFSEQAVFAMEFADTVAISDADYVPRLETALSLSDSFTLAGVFALSDEEKYLAWVVNAATLGPYKFQNYPFNSFAEVDEKPLACAKDGIYDLSTDSGETVGAYLRTGLMDFGAETKKSLDEAYLAYTADGDTLLKTIFSDGGEKTESWYRMQARTAEITRQSEIPIHRGIEAVYWQFELIPLDGKPARYKQMTLKPLITNRMI